MKYSIAILAAAGAAVAQDLASLPACGQTCIQNMVGIASTVFGCAAGDVNCYCTKIDFGYGVRDCATEACGSAEEAGQVISYGVNYCAQALASAGDGASTITASALSVLSSAATEIGASPTDGAQSTPVTTSPLATTYVSDGSTIVETTGSVTLFGPVGGATPTGDAESTPVTTSPLATTIVSDGSTVVQTTGFVTLFGPVGGDGSSSSDGGDSSSDAGETPTGSDDSQTTTTEGAPSNTEGAPSETGTGTGAAPMITAAPVIGAGALAAALLFL